MTTKQRIAVVGSGIAGLGCAFALDSQHDVTIYEAGTHFGGHTHTHDVRIGGQTYAVDSGFIVCNDAHYPLLMSLFDKLGVRTQDTTMSFAVDNQRSGLQYNATNLNRLFVQRRNLLRPSFLRMGLDIMRFYRDAPALLSHSGNGPTIGDYLRENRYSELFIHDHLVPMTSALWSSPSTRAMDFPAKYLVQFMANHQMLSLGSRKPWRVVSGGSKQYVDKLLARFTGTTHLQTPVLGLSRGADTVTVYTAQGSTTFDQVVLACHSDQALSILGEGASRAEREILGSIAYQKNETTLHSDASIMPKDRRVWASWVAHIPTDASEDCSVTYWMNLLQGLHDAPDLLVSLNMGDKIDPAKVHSRMTYHHPVYSHQSVAAQARRSEINGAHHVWFAGAYWGWGFHEDGLRSGIDVARALGGSF